MGPSPGFTKDIYFDEIGIFEYPEAIARRHSITLVEANGTPILSYWQLGKGLAVFDGLETNSDFYFLPEYPIFRYGLVNWLTGIPDISQLNHRTGEVIPLGKMKEVNSPLGPESVSNLLFDKEGVYRFQGKTADMYDPKESDLSDGASYPPASLRRQSLRRPL